MPGSEIPGPAGLLDGGREDHEVVAIRRTIGRRARCDEGGEWRLADRTEGYLRIVGLSTEGQRFDYDLEVSL